MRTSGIIFARHLGVHLEPHSISLTQRKLESGQVDSGCLYRINVCSTPEILLYCVEKRVL